MAITHKSIRDIINISEKDSLLMEEKAVELLKLWKNGTICNSKKFFNELYAEAKKVDSPAAYFAAGMYAEMLNRQVIEEQKQKDQLGEMFLKPKGKWYK